MTISPENRWLVVMVKEPRPGRVKTRLGREIGMVAAASWYRRQVTRLLRDVRDPRWQTVLAIDPDRAGMASRVWPADLARLSQGRGSLGDRMGRVFRALPSGPAMIVGSDIPDLTRRHVARGFEALRGADAVLGPAPDGGYWLIGIRRQRRLPGQLFRGVRWSTEYAMRDTERSLEGLRVVHTGCLADVDTAADLGHRGIGVAARV